MSEKPVKKSGNTRIQMDKSTLNILLKEFVIKDDITLSYEGGEVVMDKGGLRVSLRHLPLKGTQFKVDGKFGAVYLDVADFKLEESQLELDLEVGVEK